MSKQIEDQIAHMLDRIDCELPPITLDELNTMLELSEAVAPTTRSRGSVLAITVASIVLIVVAGIAVLLNNPGKTPPADKVLTTAAESTPTTLREQAPTTMASDTTVAPPATTGPEIVSPTVGAIAGTLALLEVALEQDEVRTFYGFDVKAALGYVRSYLAGAAEFQNWPKPAFDTSPLGTEILLTAFDSHDSFSELDWVQGVEAEGVFDLMDSFLAPPSSNNGGSPTVPFFAGAQLEGTTVSAAFSIVLAFKDDIVDVQWRLISEAGLSQFGPEPPPRDLEGLDVPNIILVHGVNEGTGGPVIFGGLPPDASVIATTFTDGTQVWQRPVSGIAIFDDPDRSCVDRDFTGCEGEYTALNSDGDEILRIVFGVGDDFEPFGFQVGPP